MRYSDRFRTSDRVRLLPRNHHLDEDDAEEDCHRERSRDDHPEEEDLSECHRNFSRRSFAGLVAKPRTTIDELDGVLGFAAHSHLLSSLFYSNEFL